MKKRKAKSRLTKCDLNAVLDLQRRHDELQEDCKTLVNFIINVKNGNPEPFLLSFNDNDGFPRYCYDLIREHAMWSKEPINKD